MSQKEKLIKKLLSGPKDFTFKEAETLLYQLGYTRNNKGKTSGSRIVFTSQTCAPIYLHRPHPRKTLLEYEIKNLILSLKKEGLI